MNEYSLNSSLMEPTIGRIEVRKTARYFMYGDATQPYNEIVFVLHGYGMQANEFLKSFEALHIPGRLIIAPEGLSRFYRKAFSGDVVASWMTKEDRLNEINDYILYLEDLFDKFSANTAAKKVVLGFSQGATTASRWLMNGKSRVDDFVVWCGEFAPDIHEFPTHYPRIWHVSAQRDEFIPQERFKKQREFLLSIGFEVMDYSFDDGHILHQPTLLQLWTDLNQ